MWNNVLLYSGFSGCYRQRSIITWNIVISCETITPNDHIFAKHCPCCSFVPNTWRIPLVNTLLSGTIHLNGVGKHVFKHRYGTNTWTWLKFDIKWSLQVNWTQFYSCPRLLGVLPNTSFIWVWICSVMRFHFTVLFQMIKSWRTLKHLSH